MLPVPVIYCSTIRTYYSNNYNIYLYIIGGRVIKEDWKINQLARRELEKMVLNTIANGTNNCYLIAELLYLLFINHSDFITRYYYYVILLCCLYPSIRRDRGGESREPKITLKIKYNKSKNSRPRYYLIKTP